MASGAARSRGHDIDGWEWVEDADTVAATATCRRCGRTAYIRTEGPLKGVAGRALTEACGQREESE
jgi:hypothetical protein